ncbi:hypothetical protein HS1genome_1013 [Sulfodiicoccus acidiphilus]|uniref:Uncharacterized protein n=1 Tax=Sulfodiicoccus acidiphilus TaxID=1670455 RepID=A0A348B372_9CREN|nr:hypothetical protein [Sulfodiicoccus acidiphilus]BBD72624.1 hypothetical protein HS1genome_1013 [Sulfodiicoccus acidiphilus]GGT93243.1 hypothetical protein GCM10007116_08630 [Sulfodiicoccus acidiphilus]
MPRRKKEPEEVQKKTRKRPEKKLDVEELLEEYLDEVVDGLRLSNLGLPRDMYYEILREPFFGAVGEVKTKPKARTIINRLNNVKRDLFDYIAVRITRELDHLNKEQLDFAAQYVNRGIVEVASKLYREAIRLNATENLEFLRSTWRLNGINSPVSCPKCGFNSVMPDGICMVCGKEVSESEIKRQLNIISKLRELKIEDPEAYREIVSSNYFYYVDNRIIPPSRVKHEEGRLRFEIVLTKRDREELEGLSS